MLLIAAAIWCGWILYLLEELPVLDNEMFHSIKPGLSAYADSPEMVSSFQNLINYMVCWLYIVFSNTASSIYLWEIAFLINEVRQEKS